MRHSLIIQVLAAAIMTGIVWVWIEMFGLIDRDDGWFIVGATYPTYITLCTILADIIENIKIKLWDYNRSPRSQKRKGKSPSR